MKPAKGDKGACDRIFSQLVRMRGACQRCGAFTNLQCAHIISRRYSATRCDLKNAWCLCARCHFWVDGHFEAKWALVVSTIGEDAFQSLTEWAYANNAPWDWKAEKERLSRLREQMGDQGWRP